MGQSAYGESAYGESAYGQPAELEWVCEGLDAEAWQPVLRLDVIQTDLRKCPHLLPLPEPGMAMISYLLYAYRSCLFEDVQQLQDVYRLTREKLLVTDIKEARCCSQLIS
jgi:hypothetical protein